MNIDKRYLDILANNYPYKVKKWYNILATFGYLLFIFGLLFIVTNDNSPGAALIAGMKQSTFGTIIAAIGLALISVMMYFKGVIRKKGKKSFYEFYDKTGELLPLPEVETKNDLPATPKRPL